MNRFPSNYEAYLAYQRAYAGQDCGFWDLACKAGQAIQGADKFVKDGLNQIVQNNVDQINRLRGGGTKSPDPNINPATGLSNDTVKSLTNQGATVLVPNPAHPSSGGLLNASEIVIPGSTSSGPPTVDNWLSQLNKFFSQFGIPPNIMGIPTPFVIGGVVGGIILVMVVIKR